MRISNREPLKLGEAIPVGMWFFEIEILKRSPYKIGVFQPWFSFVCVKVIDRGEPYKIDGRPFKKLGGWWRWQFPIGIRIEITK